MALYLKHKNTKFQIGDTIKLYQTIVEGNKKRTQVFEGLVYKSKGQQSEKSFTIRKISGGIGVEKIYPLDSPFIQKIEVVHTGKVRRAKLYFLKERTGRSALKVKTAYNKKEIKSEKQAISNVKPEAKPRQTRRSKSAKSSSK